MSVASSLAAQSAEGLDHDKADRSWEHRNSSLVFQIPHWGWRRGNSPCLVLVGCLGACPRIRRLFPLSRLDDTNTFTPAHTLTLRFQIFYFLFLRFFLFFCRSKLRHCWRRYTVFTAQLRAQNNIEQRDVASVQRSPGFFTVSLSGRGRKEAPSPVKASIKRGSQLKEWISNRSQLYWILFKTELLSI